MHLDLKISTRRVLNLEAMGKFSMGTDNTQLNYVVHKCEIGFSKVVTQKSILSKYIDSGKPNIFLKRQNFIHISKRISILKVFI